MNADEVNTPRYRLATALSVALHSGLSIHLQHNYNINVPRSTVFDVPRPQYERVLNVTPWRLFLY